MRYIDMEYADDPGVVIRMHRATRRAVLLIRPISIKHHDVRMSLQINCILCALQVVRCIIDMENVVPIKLVLANVDIKSFLGQEDVFLMILFRMEDLCKKMILQ